VRVTPECDTIDSVAVCNFADSQFGPSVVFDGLNYIVVWSDRRFNGANWWVTAARVSPEGARLDTGVPVGGCDAHNEYYPDIAYDGARCLVVWYHSYYPPYGIYARFVSHSAQPEDTVLVISPALTHLYNVAKVAFGVDRYLVVWADQHSGGTDYDILGQMVSPAGELLGSRILIAPGASDQTRPDVEFVGSEFLVVWVEAGRILGQQVDQQGQLVGGPFAVSETTANARDYPRLSSQGNQYLAVWYETRSSAADIYCRLGTLPGIAEQAAPRVRKPRQYEPSLLTSFPALPVGAKLRIYDCSGRPQRIGPTATGIYFLVDGSHVAKRIYLGR